MNNVTTGLADLERNVFNRPLSLSTIQSGNKDKK